MTFPQLVSVGLLVVVLILSLWRHLNIGLLAFAATFVLVLVAGQAPEEILRFFPAGIFTLLVGISMLFSHLERSGALGWLVILTGRLFGNRQPMIPWIGFVIGAGISTMGALSGAPCCF